MAYFHALRHDGGEFPNAGRALFAARQLADEVGLEPPRTLLDAQGRHLSYLDADDRKELAAFVRELLAREQVTLVGELADYLDASEGVDEIDFVPRPQPYESWLADSLASYKQMGLCRDLDPARLLDHGLHGDYEDRTWSRGEHVEFGDDPDEGPDLALLLLDTERVLSGDSKKHPYVPGAQAYRWLLESVATIAGDSVSITSVTETDPNEQRQTTVSFELDGERHALRGSCENAWLDYRFFLAQLNGLLANSGGRFILLGDRLAAVFAAPGVERRLREDRGLAVIVP